MSKILIISKNIIKRVFQKPANYVLYIILPIALSIGMFALFNEDTSDKYSALLVDMSNSESSKAIIDSIASTEKYEFIVCDEDSVSGKITEGKASFALIFGQDFEDQIISGQNPDLKIMSLKQSEASGWIMASLDFQIKNLLDIAFATDYNKQEYLQVVSNLDNGEIEFAASIVDDFSNEVEVTSQMLGMYLMIIMLCAGNMCFIVLEEKRMGTYSRIGCAPVNRGVYVLANFLVCMIVFTVQILLVLTITSVFLGITFNGGIAYVFLALLVYTICCVGLGLYIASISDNQAVASAAMSLILAPSCMIAGCFWPMEFMPEILKKVAYLTPQRWTLDAIVNIQSGADNLTSFSNIAVVLGFALLFFLGSIYRGNSRALSNS